MAATASSPKPPWAPAGTCKRCANCCIPRPEGVPGEPPTAREGQPPRQFRPEEQEEEERPKLDDPDLDDSDKNRNWKTFGDLLKEEKAAREANKGKRAQ